MAKVPANDLEEREKLAAAEKKAADFDPDGLFELGWFYENPPAAGWITRNLDEALWYYKASVWEAHKRGLRYGRAALRAGLLLYNGTESVTDTGTAYHYLYYSAEAGYAHAQFLLGLYHMGDQAMGKSCGINRIPATGVRYFKLAAEQGYAEAMFQLSVAYADGNGTVANDDLAIQWAIKAAEKGDVIAMFNAGTFYERNRNYGAAGIWFNEAANQGFQPAIEALRQYSYSDFLGTWRRIG